MEQYLEQRPRAGPCRGFLSVPRLARCGIGGRVPRLIAGEIRRCRAVVAVFPNLAMIFLQVSLEMSLQDAPVRNRANM